MKRLTLVFLTWITLLAAGSVPAVAGDVIDGVVATVNKTPILLSEWQDSVAFEAFMQQKPMASVSELERIAALQRLIDRHLLELQMKGEKALKPSAKDVQDQLAKLRAQISGATDESRWQQILSSYGLTHVELERELSQQVEVMNFIEVRLRPAIHITSEEIANYYQNTLLPDLRSNRQATVALTDAAPKIRELLTQQQMDEMLDAWLHNLRQQAKVDSSVPLRAIDSGDTPSSGQGGK